MAQGLQTTTLQASTHRDCGGIHRTIYGTQERRVSFLDHHAWTRAEHDLDTGDLIATSLGTVGVQEPNGNPLDGRREFTELPAKFARNNGAITAVEPAADYANVSRRWHSGASVPRDLHRAGP